MSGTLFASLLIAFSVASASFACAEHIPHAATGDASYAMERSIRTSAEHPPVRSVSHKPGRPALGAASVARLRDAPPAAAHSVGRPVVHAEDGPVLLVRDAFAPTQTASAAARSAPQAAAAAQVPAPLSSQAQNTQAQAQRAQPQVSKTSAAATASPLAGGSTLPPMAPTVAKVAQTTNAIPPLPAPLPTSVANRSLAPATPGASALAIPAVNPPTGVANQTTPGVLNGVAAVSPSKTATALAAASPGAVAVNLPPGPLTSAPANELRISGLGGSSVPWSIVLLLTGLTLIPSLLICLTPFARLLVVFHFLRQALGLQTTPSNQTLIGLTMILTFFIMEPVGKQIYQQSFVPLQNGEITVFQAAVRGEDPMRNFMVHFVREKDAELFLEIAHEPRPHDIHDLSMRVLLPAYIVSELKAGFQIGAVLFLPFLVVDMVVASITTSVGMMQLPPVVISTPLKLLLFLMVDGWHLLISALMRSFA